MRIKVNPLVVAAALGLIGPAALADEDEDEREGLAGVWQRQGSTVDRSPLHLGDRIEVIPFEGRVLLDDGAHGPQGDWTQESEDLHRQDLVVDGKTITRSFHATGDHLQVRTIVLQDNGAVTWLDTFVRQG